MQNEVTVDYKRQSGIASPRLMAEMPVVVCGMGTTGSNTAYQLARLGTKMFTLIDFDKVEPHNLPSQQFLMSDIGRYKAEAAKDQIESITHGADVEVILERIDDGDFEGVVVFGFDNMESRRNVFEMAAYLRPSVSLVVDVRLAGNNIQVFAFNPCDEDAVKMYKLFDFNDEEASELPCGGEMVAYVGAMCGGMVANVVRQHVMGERVPFMVSWNLETWKFTETKALVKSS